MPEGYLSEHSEYLLTGTSQINQLQKRCHLLVYGWKNVKLSNVYIIVTNRYTLKSVINKIMTTTALA